MLSSLLLLLFCAGAAVSVDWDVVTPLDRYVQGDDGYFSYTEMTSYRYDGVTLYIVNMTSQKWQNESYVDRPVWWHFMGIAIPDDLEYLNAGFIYIDASSNSATEPPPIQDASNVIVARFANQTRTIGAYVKQVPNQPLVFANDPSQRRRSEDSIIAWTWRTYIDAAVPDPEVILRMPMTKAAKRGLDTIHAFAKEKVPETDIKRFLVAGASKRGWTTWSLAATDRRVAVMAPFVFSMLNMNVTVMQHNRDMDGGWSFVFEPYWRENLTQEFYNPKTAGVFEVEDMYNYRERLTMPKLEMLSSGDEFFLCDDSLSWWKDIPNPKHMLMLQNAEHSMAPHYGTLFETVSSYWELFLQGEVIPTVNWQLYQTENGGSITLTSNPPPVEMTAWTATTLDSDTRRDFRLFQGPPEDVTFHPVIWRENLTVIDEGNGRYSVSADTVEGEWVGFFLQGKWPGTQGNMLTFTTQVNIIPNTYPREQCTDNVDCYGSLV